MRALVRGVAHAKDAVARVQSYIGGVNTLILVGIAAPLIYGSDVINSSIPLTQTLTFTQFLVMLYATFGVGVILLVWLDNRYFRGAEHGRANSFQPFALEPAFNVTWHIARLEAYGVDAGSLVRRYAKQAAQLGREDEFHEYLRLCRIAVEREVRTPSSPAVTLTQEQVL